MPQDTDGSVYVDFPTLARCLRVVALLVEYPNQWVKLIDSYALPPEKLHDMLTCVVNLGATYVADVSVQIRKDAVYFCNVRDEV